MLGITRIVGYMFMAVSSSTLGGSSLGALCSAAAVADDSCSCEALQDDSMMTAESSQKDLTTDKRKSHKLKHSLQPAVCLMNQFPIKFQLFPEVVSEMEGLERMSHRYFHCRFVS